MTYGGHRQEWRGARRTSMYFFSGILGKITFRWRWLQYNWQLAVFTWCRTEHQLSRQSQNFDLPWTLTEMQKHSRPSAFKRQLCALLPVKSKSSFSCSSYKLHCDLLWIDLQSDWTFSWSYILGGGDGSKTKCRKITLQFSLGMLVYLGYLSQLHVSQFELELNICSANTEVNFLFLALDHTVQVVFNESTGHQLVYKVHVFKANRAYMLVWEALNQFLHMFSNAMAVKKPLLHLQIWVW